MFTVHNTERGELSETDSMSGAMLAAYTHLVEDGEKAPLTILEGNEPRAVVTWLPVGSRNLVHVGVKEERS